MRKFVLSAILAACVPALSAGAATLSVGPGQAYTTIAAAIAASADGDTVAVQAGTYTNDFAEITTQITLRAVGGRVTMKATEPPLQDKGILITDTNVTITGFNFAGAHISMRLAATPPAYATRAAIWC